jgi:hypothetical protein
MAEAIVKPNRFAPDAQRRALIAKVHIAPKQLGMTEEDYRATLHRVTGRISAAECSVEQLTALVAEFGRKGFRTSGGARQTTAAQRADHPMARKARALWISLGLLCGVQDHSEKALEGFAKRQLGCDRLQWANQAEGDRLIEALKARAERHGWPQSLAGLGKAHHVHALKRRLCDAILFKLKRSAVIPSSWELGDAAWKLCGLADPDQGLFETGELDQIANALGRVLRDKGGQLAFEEVNP